MTTENKNIVVNYLEERLSNGGVAYVVLDDGLVSMLDEPVDFVTSRSDFFLKVSDYGTYYVVREHSVNDGLPTTVKTSRVYTEEDVVGLVLVILEDFEEVLT